MVVAAFFAASATAQPRYRTEVEIEGHSGVDGAVSAPFHAEGGVASPKRACRFGRTVEVHLVQGSADTVVASTTTLYQPGTPGGEVEGFWSADTTHPPAPFSYYAVATREAHRRYVCRPAVSAPLTYP